MPRKPLDRGADRGRRAARFNEAAARCRGNPAERLAIMRRWAGFNEAAARCRGNPGVGVTTWDLVVTLQ